MKSALELLLTQSFAVIVLEAASCDSFRNQHSRRCIVRTLQAHPANMIRFTRSFRVLARLSVFPWQLNACIHQPAWVSVRPALSISQRISQTVQLTPSISFLRPCLSPPIQAVSLKITSPSALWIYGRDWQMSKVVTQPWIAALRKSFFALNVLVGELYFVK